MDRGTVVIGAVVWLVARAAGSGSGAGPTDSADRAEAILKERFTRGEIDADGYASMLQKLRQ